MFRGDLGFTFRVEDEEVCGFVFGNPGGSEVEEGAGGVATGFDEFFPGDQAGFDEVVVECREECVEHAHSVGGGAEVLLFFKVGDGGVVGDDAVDGAVIKGGDEVEVVFFVAQGGCCFEGGVVVADVFVGEEEVVQGDFGAQTGVLLFPLPDDVRRDSGGDGLDMEGVFRVGGEADDGVGADFFSAWGDRRQAEEVGGLAWVHGCVGREGREVTADGEGHSERAGILHGPVKEEEVFRSFIGVGQESDTVASEGVVGDLFPAFHAFGDAACGDDFEDAVFFTYFSEEFDAGGAVEGGRGVGHGLNAGDAALKGRFGGGGDAFTRFVAGLAEVRVEVEEAGKDERAGGVDFGCSFGFFDLACRFDANDGSVVDQDVDGGVRLAGGGLFDLPDDEG